MFDKVFVTSFTTLRPYSTTMLCTEFRQRSTFDISQMRNSYHHFIISIEIFRIEFFRSIYNFRTSLITIFFLHFDKFILDNLFTKFFISQNFFKVGNLFHQFFIFSMQLILQKSCKLTKAHFYNSTRLNFCQLEAIHQICDSLIRSLGSTYDANYFIDIIRSNYQSFQYMSTFLSLAQIELSTTNHYFMTMLNKQANQVFQIQQLRTTMYQGNVIYAERCLQSCHFEQLVQYNAGIRITFYINYNAHTFTVGLIVHIRDTFYFLVIYQSCNILYQLLLIDIIRNLVNDNLIVCRM